MYCAKRCNFWSTWNALIKRLVQNKIDPCLLSGMCALWLFFPSFVAAAWVVCMQRFTAEEFKKGTPHIFTYGHYSSRRVLLSLWNPLHNVLRGSGGEDDPGDVIRPVSDSALRKDAVELHCGMFNCFGPRLKTQFKRTLGHCVEHNGGRDSPLCKTWLYKGWHFMGSGALYNRCVRFLLFFLFYPRLYTKALNV